MAWGIGPWGNGTWGIGDPNINVDVTGVQGNVFLEPVGVSADKNSQGAGEQAVVLLGEDVVSAKSNVALVGVEASGNVGTVVVVSKAVVNVTGVEGTGETGTATVNASYPVTGVQGLGQVVRSGVFKAVNQAKLSTAQEKFGPSSLVTDGFFDYVIPTQNCVWGDGDFTIEFWVYRTSNPSGNQFLFDNRISSNNGLLISVGPTGRISTSINGVGGGSVVTSINTWNSVALVRSGTSISFYVNGVSPGGTYAPNTTDYSDRIYAIGAGTFSVLGAFSFNGYIDEFRISTIARYGSDYTPANSEFIADQYTDSLLHFDGPNNSTVIANSATEGLVVVRGSANTEVTGVEATSELGQVEQRTVNRVPVTGVEGVGETGVATEITAKAVVFPVGVVGTGQLGEEEVQGDANVTLTGVEAQGVVDSVQAISGAKVVVTGVVGTVQLGETDEGGGAVVSVTGVQAVGIIATPLVWGIIDDNQVPNWQNVNDAQSPSWTTINDGNTVVWVQIP